MSDAPDTLPSETDSPATPSSIGPRDRLPDAPAKGSSDSSAAAPSPDMPEPTESRFGLRRSDRVFVTLLAGVALSLMGVHWLRLSGWGMKPVEVQRGTSRTYEYRIDINTAAESELVQLEGIGPTLAKRIVADRDRNGPFRTIDDLRGVRGIGPRKVQTIRKWLTLGRP